MVLILTNSASSFRLKGQAVTWTDFSRITYIAASSRSVYFATTGGLIKYNTMSTAWELPYTGADGAINELIQYVAVNDFDDKLYIGTSAGLYEFDPLFERWYPITEIPTMDKETRHIQQPGDLLPSPELNFVEDGRITDRYNRNFGLTDILDDGQGNLWIGSDGYGAFTASSSARIMQWLPYGLIQPDVSTILLDGDNLWLGGRTLGAYRTGLTCFDLENNQFRYVESGVDISFPARDVYSLALHGSDIYCATDDGIYVVGTDSPTGSRRIGRRYGLPDDVVNSLLIKGDSLFIGTAQGACCLDLKTDSLYILKPDEFGGRTIYDLEMIGDYLWIGAESGAYRMSLADGKLQRFNDPTNVLFTDVYDIESFDKDIWFVADGGLLRLDTQTGETEPFLNQAHLGFRRVLAVNGTVAAATSNNGLTLFYYKSAKKIQRQFTDGDGLASTSVRALLFDGDYLWVGSDKGLTRFWWNNPDRVD